MNVMSIDIETTGLDPEKHGITEFAAVYGDIHAKNYKAVSFYVLVHPEDLVWSSYCLNMHRHSYLKDVLSDVPSIRVVETESLKAAFDWWASSLGETKFTPAGKNFGSFDLQFLKKLGFGDSFRHRSLDPTTLYTERGDTVPPDLKLCKARAIKAGFTDLKPEVAHNALEDATDVFKLLWWSNNKGN